jgi:hypothetical protein
MLVTQIHAACPQKNSRRIRSVIRIVSLQSWAKSVGRLGVTIGHHHDDFLAGNNQDWSLSRALA